jgi:DNA-binding transcriptional LysR family regulator
MAIDVLTGMRVFTTVVDLQSFAKAAEKLDLSRGMTSRYVAQVEAHLGVRLLHRTTRRLSLTEAGSDYYQRAAQVLALVDEAERAAAKEVAEPRGTLRISAPLAFAATHLGAAISAYLQRHPQVKVDLSLNDRIIDLVDEGFDLAIRIAHKLDAGLVARPITPARMVVCASPAYLKKHGQPRTPADLAAHNCLTYTSTTVAPRVWPFRRRGRETTVRVGGTLHADNGNILCAAAAEGVGIVLQPTFLAHELLRSRKLVRVLEDWTVDPLTIYAVYPDRQYLPPKVRTLIDFLVARFGARPYWDQGLP